LSADTVVAISTAPGRAALAVVRLSGREAIEIAGMRYRGRERLQDLASHSVRHGRVFDANGELIDEVLVSVMRGPESYTGEDVVEISCHGGLLVSQLVLEALVKAGARVAEPGEFTKRAFLNNKLDLAQAEAVAEVVAASTRRALENALGQLEGKISVEIRNLRAGLVETLAQMEARIDFPEDVLENLDVAGVCTALGAVASRLRALVAERASAVLLSAGARVPIVGRPNVGKSSLLNSLVGHSRAIVHAQPGTTRDTIEEDVEIQGIPVKLIDTAGLRSAKEEVEEEGVRRSRDEIRQAQVVIFVVDASAQHHRRDAEIVESTRASDNRPVVIAINKIDIASPERARAALTEEAKQCRVVEVSAKQGTGIEALKEILGEALLRSEVEAGEVRCASQRHVECLRSALRNVEAALSGLDEKAPDELVAFELREAAEELGAVTGETVGPDVLDIIFSRFCVGK
jgi:tRNA modification GTPase